MIEQNIATILSPQLKSTLEQRLIWLKQLCQRPIDVEVFEGWYKQRLFVDPATGKSNVQPAVVEQLISKTRKGDFSFWVSGDFSPEQPPNDHHGINLCYRCGSVYWITPMDDAWVMKGKEDLGRVCSRCFNQAIGEIRSGKKSNTVQHQKSNQLVGSDTASKPTSESSKEISQDVSKYPSSIFDHLFKKRKE